MPRSYRQKHYIRAESATTRVQTVTLDVIREIPALSHVVIKNCEFVAVESANTSFATSYVTEASFYKLTATGTPVAGNLAITTRYYGSFSLTPAAGNIVGSAAGDGSIVFQATGIYDSETGLGQNIRWYLEYELFWQEIDLPE